MFIAYQKEAGNCVGRYETKGLMPSRLAQVIALADYRAQLYDYLKSRMVAIAPNLTILVGELVGARLIAHAGSLVNLAKQPASTVQVLLPSILHHPILQRFTYHLDTIVQSFQALELDDMTGSPPLHCTSSEGMLSIAACILHLCYDACAHAACSLPQILGAEKALFRALKTKHETPKYGLIYHASLIGQAAPKFKGKIARVLAAKCAISTRVDALGDAPDATIGLDSRVKVGPLAPL